MSKRNRKIQLKFYVSEQEREYIKLKMKQYKTTNMGAYLRKISIDGYVIVPDHKDIRENTAELQKIGVNVNQITKRINTTNTIYQSDMDEIKDLVKEVWRLQRKILFIQP